MSDNSYFPEDEKGINTTTIFGILFLPVTIVGFVYHYIFQRKIKLALSDTIFIGFLSSLFFGLLIKYCLSVEYVKYSFLSVFSTPYIAGLVASIVLPSLFFGVITGVIFCIIQDYKMKHNPELVATPGDWMYKFKYKPSFRKQYINKRNVICVQHGEYTSFDETCVGISEEDLEPVFRHTREASTHTLVLGSSGSGKTVTMTNLMYGDIMAGRTVLCIDFKFDAGLASKLAYLSKTYGKNFYHFTCGTKYNIPYSNGFSTYDPLSGGGATSKIERLMSLRRWTADSDVYKNAYNSVVDPVVKAYCYITDNRRFFSDELLVKHNVKLDFDKPLLSFVEDLFVDNRFVELATAVSIQTDITTETVYDRENRTRIHSQLVDIISAMESGKVNNVRNAVEQIAAKVRTILNSEYGLWLNPVDGYNHIDLLKLLSEDNNVILFSFSIEDTPDFAEFMGSLVFADIATVFSNRISMGATNIASIYADEFQSVNPDVVQGLLQKARAANMPITLGLQSLNSLAGKYDGNVNSLVASMKEVVGNFIIHNGMDSATATSFANDIGKHTVTKYDVQRQSKKTFLSFNWFNKRENVVKEREVQEYIFSPDNFLKLESPSVRNNYVPTAVFLKKSDVYNNVQGMSACKVRCIVPSIILQSHELLQGDDVKVAFYETTLEYEQNKGAKQLVGNDSIGVLPTDRVFSEDINNADISNYDLARYSVVLGDGDNCFIDDEFDTNCDDNDFSLVSPTQVIYEKDGVVSTLNINNDNDSQKSLPDIDDESTTFGVREVLLEEHGKSVSRNYFKELKGKR